VSLPDKLYVIDDAIFRMFKKWFCD